MSVTVRHTESGSWEVDLHVVLPNGRRHRERRRLKVSSKSAALHWGRARERKLLVDGVPIDYALARIPAPGESRGNHAV